MKIDRFPAFMRLIKENIQLIMANYESRVLARKCNDDVKAFTDIKKFLSICRKVRDGFTGIDLQSSSVLILRCVPDNVAVTQHSRHLGSFIRSLFVIAENAAETTHKADFCRFNVDTVQAEGKANRGLLLFIRIITKVILRNYVIWRFLKAKQELVIKSPVSREIVLDSKLS
jgi:hypothetical protein